MGVEDSLTVQPQTPAPQDHPDLLLGLPRWQRVYLSARASGDDDKSAVAKANVSFQCVGEHVAKSRARVDGTRDWDGGRFARAFDAIVGGVYVAGGPAAVRARHLESADAILDRFTALALDRAIKDGAPEEVRHRDQISAGDRVLAAVQLTGAQPPPAVDGKAIADAFFNKLRALRDAERTPAPATDQAPQRQLPAPPDTDSKVT